MNIFIVLIICAFYGLIGLELILSDDYFVVRYLHFLYSFFMLASIGFSLYLLIAHRKKLIWFIPALLFIVISYWLPMIASENTQHISYDEKQQKEFTLLSFSMNKSNHKYDDVAKVLKENPADIMCLQELPFDQYEVFKKVLKTHNIDMHHNYAKEENLMVLSKTPLTPLKTTPYMQTKTHLGGQEVLVWNLHSPKSLHLEHHQTIFMNLLRADVQENEHPHKIVCGDFNSTPQNDAMKSFFQFLTPSFHAAKNKGLFTYPSPGSEFLSPIPFIKIDYLLFSAPFKVLSYERLSEFSHSDHYPIKSVISM
ncbi:MAG: Unknown protein [uncultured Thiotrichaceae bacterium]|uniref:Endonuclease/exonuclease/phosphatase domain-containing protein n=1 Tax=uncultured Thiotrichaceae bacterium TaxID=298394 RepID=A0A6S6U333_9GAMM|nr:MAG: Unknown protein [uncultured Thiotrichaceae bacterium]